MTEQSGTMKQEEVGNTTSENKVHEKKNVLRGSNAELCGGSRLSCEMCRGYQNPRLCLKLFIKDNKLAGITTKYCGDPKFREKIRKYRKNAERCSKQCSTCNLTVLRCFRSIAAWIDETGSFSLTNNENVEALRKRHGCS